MLSFAALMWVMDMGGDDLRAKCALETGKIMQGEIWRLGCAHLVNLSHVHTILNLLGLCLITAATWSVLTASGFVWSVLASAGAISFGWLLLQPAGPTYVGFSGTTHGVLTFGALIFLRRGPYWFGWMVLIGVAIKIGFEVFYGPIPNADEAIGGRVSTLSHSLGATGGALAAYRVGERRMRLVAILVFGLSIIPNTMVERAIFKDMQRLEAPAIETGN